MVAEVCCARETRRAGSVGDKRYSLQVQIPLRNSVTTSCRICAGQCGLQLDIDEGGKVIAARADRQNPVSQGYACIEGLSAHEALRHPDRLLHPLKRSPDGSFVPIALEAALDEIAVHLRELIAAEGPQTIAGFRGTMSYCNATANRMLPDWLRSLGSDSFFSTMTIDQSAKWVTFERLGAWAAGRDSFEVAEVLLLVGTNPLVSLSTFNFSLQHPVNRMREFKARGGKLIVIDPRRTETARHADLFLQPWPGGDVTLIAAILHEILANNWQDHDFCERYVQGLDALRDALARYTPSYATDRCGVPQVDIEKAAKLFAHECRRGSAASGTGPNMGPHSNLAEHLIECLNVICGRYAREGDRVSNPGVIGPRQPRLAQVIPPRRRWEHGPFSRVRGLGRLFGEKMSAVLADEIIQPGPGRLRALIVDGGNPASCVPDQRRMVEALRSLDLLVCIEPFMTNTARLAHYIIPPKLMFERYDLPSRDYETIVLNRPYAQYAVPVVEPPPGSEVVDDWYPLWAIAKRLGQAVTFDGVALDMNTAPSTEDLLALLARHGAITFETLRKATGGQIFDVEPMTVGPGDAQSDAKFAVLPADVAAELAVVRNESTAFSGASHRLAVRRMRDVQNSMHRELPSVRRRVKHNPAWLHPLDLEALGAKAGDQIEIRSTYGAISAIAAADPSLRSGVVALSHGWGGLPGESQPCEMGTCVGLLIDAGGTLDPINGMPVMTGVPVSVSVQISRHGCHSRPD